MSMKFLPYLKHAMISHPWKFHHNGTTIIAAMDWLTKSVDLKLQQKNYIKTYRIIYLLCISTNVESKKISFPFYDLCLVYYDFLKIQQK
jgi:hypothetical protein